jgi:methylated-DNA-protein-cysteine methyltransferase-like protein
VDSGFRGIIVADSFGMDRAVKRSTRISPQSHRDAERYNTETNSSPHLRVGSTKKKSKRSEIMRDRIAAAIRSIPHGKVSTYGGVARAAGYAGAARFAAAVLRRSAGMPWQRVLGSGGAIKLTGDAAMEQRLRLEAEGVHFRGRRVDMKAHEWKFGRARKK